MALLAVNEHATVTLDVILDSCQDWTEAANLGPTGLLRDLQIYAARCGPGVARGELLEPCGSAPCTVGCVCSYVPRVITLAF